MKPYEPSEWEDNEPAAKPRHPPLLLLTYPYPYKKVSGSEDKNVFSFTAHEQTIVRKVICDENELSADDVMISDLSNVGKK